MADRSLKGPKPFKIFADQRYRLDWYRLPVEGLPPNYQTHYIAYYEGKPRGEMFWGKCEQWICFAYEGPEFTCSDNKEAALHLVAAICGGPKS